MILNPRTFQAIILQCSKNVKNFEPTKLKIEKAKVEATNEKVGNGKWINEYTYQYWCNSDSNVSV